MNPARVPLADHLVAMVRRLPPTGAPVVEGSTPVVSFGDAQTAEAATLGINPSKREFVDSKGEFLRAGQRRLATLESIDAQRLDRLDDDQVAAARSAQRTSSLVLSHLGLPGTTVVLPFCHDSRDARLR